MGKWSEKVVLQIWISLKFVVTVKVIMRLLKWILINITTKMEKIKIQTQELFGKFSFICRKCDLLNILSFDEICNRETVLFLREKDKKN